MRDGRPWVFALPLGGIALLLLQQASLASTQFMWSNERREDFTVGGRGTGKCSVQRVFHGEDADVFITGLLAVHGGTRCGLVDPAGVQLLEAARWAVKRLNDRKFLPFTRLGLTAYDTCGTEDAALRTGVEAVVKSGLLDDPDCGDAPPSAVLLANTQTPSLLQFLQDVDVAHLAVGPPNLRPQLEALVPLLVRLNWTSVAVAAPTTEILKQFGSMAAKARVCVGAEALLPYTTSDPKVYRAVLEVLSTGRTGAVVLLGPQDRLQATLASAAMYNITTFNWILAPSGPIQEKVFQGLDNAAAGLLAVRRVTRTVPQFGEHFLSVASSSNAESTLYPSITFEDYVEEPSVFKVVDAVFQIATTLRKAIKDHCEGQRFCSNATQAITSSSLRQATQDGSDVIEELSIKSQSPRYEILNLQWSKESRLTFRKVGFFSSGVLDMDQSEVRSYSVVGTRLLNYPQYPCSSCRCLNIRFSFLADLTWRQDTWVTICVTMAITGVVAAISIFTFISVRSCRGNTTEGSQAFTLLLLTASVLLYAAILPYSFEASELTCALRPFATALAYALVFSIMLSRSLMLATADSEGLLGHVSGLVQTSLFFFMVCVQVGLGVQYWLLHPGAGHAAHVPSPTGVLYTCVTERLKFLISLVYVMFLLLLQLIVSPFIVKSRRNYHEGFLFFLGTLMVVSVWVAWTTLYMLLGPIWTDACVCLGLAATPTVLIVVIFIPKTYLMVHATAKDDNALTLRALQRPHSVQDMRGSSMALYDSISHLPEMTYAQAQMASAHAYSPDPTVAATTAAAIRPVRTNHDKENTYETYSHYHQPSPQKITQF
ncbi:protein bride of sevenless-like isoform X1 [Oratosquilla oratoria]|uniref:protein bride of sevenless-like isoform X1 n=1 Tax=Oratosquilla oratoria TaxID=337810 RepID=UPI003F762C65